MPGLQVGGIGVSTPSRLRVGGITAAGATPATARIRVGGITAAGSLSVVVKPLPNLTNVEPESVVTLTAALTDGSTADSWTWRVITGPIGIDGTSHQVTFPAPSALSGTTVTVGVRATKGGVQSPEVTCSISVLPQTEWWWTGTGWIPNTTWWTNPGTPAPTDPPEFGAGIFGAGTFGA